MKIKYYLFFILVFLVGIFVLLFSSSDNKKCDSHTSDRIVFTKFDDKVEIFKENKNIYVKLQKSENKNANVYLASSRVNNFWNQINPLCSEVVYPFDEKFFQEISCVSANDYEICIGGKTQKGYPIAIKKNGKFEKLMYIQDTYFIDSIIDYKNPEELIEKRIISMPPHSFINYIKIQTNDQNIEFQKKANQWFSLVEKKEIDSQKVTGFINSILMLEKKFEYEIDTQKINLENPYKIQIGLGFSNWKYSIGVKKNYSFILYSIDEKTIILKDQNSYYYITKNSFDFFINNLKNLKNKNEKDNN